LGLEPATTLKEYKKKQLSNFIHFNPCAYCSQMYLAKQITYKEVKHGRIFEKIITLWKLFLLYCLWHAVYHWENQVKIESPLKKLWKFFVQRNDKLETLLNSEIKSSHSHRQEL
jgi:hypothetical protein